MSIRAALTGRDGGVVVTEEPEHPPINRRRAETAMAFATR
jgi:hypothetical protein